MFLFRPYLYIITFLCIATGLTASLRLEPESIFLGFIPPEESVSLSFLVTNQGSQTITVDKIEPECGCTLTDTTTLSLKPKEAQTVTLKFQEARIGYFERKVVLHIGETKQVFSLHGFITPSSDYALIYPNVEWNRQALQIPVFYLTKPPVIDIPGVQLGTEDLHYKNIPYPYRLLQITEKAPATLIFDEQLVLQLTTPSVQFRALPAELNLGSVALGSSRVGFITITGPILNLKAVSPSLTLQEIRRSADSVRIKYNFSPTATGILEGELALVDETQQKHFSIPLRAIVVK